MVTGVVVVVAADVFRPLRSLPDFFSGDLLLVDVVVVGGVFPVVKLPMLPTAAADLVTGVLSCLSLMLALLAFRLRFLECLSTEFLSKCCLRNWMSSGLLALLVADPFMTKSTSRTSAVVGTVGHWTLVGLVLAGEGAVDLVDVTGTALADDVIGGFATCCWTTGLIGIVLTNACWCR